MARVNDPSAANAQEDAYAGRTREDPYDYADDQYDQKLYQTKFNDIEWMNELLALHQARMANKDYRQTFACASGLAVGDPVYVSANNTVAKADATNSTNSQVAGYCRYKPTTTSCYIAHFRYVSGLSGLTAGGLVYLTDAGGFSASAGTTARIVGVAISTTEALLFAAPLPSGSVVDAVVALTASTNLTASQSGSMITNEGSAGAASGRPVTLPSAAAGLKFKFYDQAGTGIQIVANAGDTIRIGRAVSAAAGNIVNAYIGQMVELIAINATEWVATTEVMGWTVT